MEQFDNLMNYQNLIMSSSFVPHQKMTINGMYRVYTISIYIVYT